MKISEQKDLILEETIDFLGSKGFSYSESFEHIFTKKLKIGGVKISLFFSENGESSNSLYSLSLKEVEDIMLKVGVPYNSWSKQKKGKKLLYTVYDIFTNYQFTRRSIKIGTKKVQEIKYVKTKEDVINWKNALFSYIDSEGEMFIEKYSYLPNVLSEINKIDQSNGPSFLPLLLGRLDHLFRGLIISKLCNDTLFNDKLKNIQNEIMQEKYSEWHPYYERLKERLDDMNPIYNLENNS